MSSAPLPSLIQALSGPRGLRTVVSRAVAAGELLLELHGFQVRTPGRHTLQVGVDVHLASEDAVWRFINHACEPTARLLAGPAPGPLQLIARRALAAQEEVTFNYLTTEWDLASPFTCDCGAATCVGLVRGARHLTPAQLETWGPELLPHLRRLLRASPGTKS
jgi:hypothetical protein